jgi:hypothetical protein
MAFVNCHFGDFNEGLTLKNGSYQFRNSTFENGEGTAIEGQNADIGLSETTIKNVDTGFRVEDSNFILDRTTIHDCIIGAQLLRGARGDIVDTEIIDNRKSDIEYHNQVLAGLFDSVAYRIENYSDIGDSIGWVDTHWAASRLLDTRDVMLKAKRVLDIASKAVNWTTRLRFAVKMAKLLFS